MATALLVVLALSLAACKSTAQYEKELRARNDRRFYMLRSDEATNNGRVLIHLLFDAQANACYSVYENIETHVAAPLGSVPCPLREKGGR